MTARLRTIVGPSFTVLLLLMSILGSSCASDGSFAPSQFLKGIHAIGVEVRGLPIPIGELRISDATIQEAIEEALATAGLQVAKADGLDSTPVLRITLLAPKYGDDLHGFILAVELVEPCQVARMPGVRHAGCSTWSIYPRLGFFLNGREEGLVGIALQAVDKFINSWITDNMESMDADV